jgi:hypothetical protein
MSTTAHSTVDTQDTSAICVPADSTLVTFQAKAPPVGLVEVSTSPSMLAETQNLADGQDSGPVPAAILVCFQAEAPPVGLADVSRLPFELETTQSVVEAQEISVSDAASTNVAFHAGTPPVELVEVKHVARVVDRDAQSRSRAGDGPENAARGIQASNLPGRGTPGRIGGGD